jgi:hypothetical protein
MFLEHGNSPGSVPPLHAGVGLGAQQFEPTPQTTWKQYLGSTANLVFNILPLAAPSPPHFAGFTFYSWNLTPDPGEQKKGAPGTPRFCPNFGHWALGVGGDPREAPVAGGAAADPLTAPSGEEKLSIVT